jgi:DNA recombination protein RmuC
MEGKVEQLERQRREADGRLGETLRSLHAGVDSLAAQAGNLTSALKRPTARGAWAEIQLRNVIECWIEQRQAPSRGPRAAPSSCAAAAS